MDYNYAPFRFRENMKTELAGKQRPLDITLAVVLGLLLLVNGLFMLVCGIMLMSKDFSTKVGAIVLLIAAAALEFLFWKLIRTPLRRLRAGEEALVHANGMRYAGVGSRLTAGFIDLLLFAPVIAAQFLVSPWNVQRFEFCFWASCLYYPYLVLMISRYGQTVGKMAVGITVYHDDGAPMTLKTSLKRASVDLLMGAVFIGAHLHALSKLDLGFSFKTYAEAYWYFNDANSILGKEAWIGMFWAVMEYLSICFSGRKKAIHDYIGGTIVLVTKKKNEG